jgi:hypothetical protein
MRAHYAIMQRVVKWCKPLQKHMYGEGSSADMQKRIITLENNTFDEHFQWLILFYSRKIPLPWPTWALVNIPKCTSWLHKNPTNIHVIQHSCDFFFLIENTKDKIIESVPMWNVIHTFCVSLKTCLFIKLCGFFLLFLVFSLFSFYYHNKQNDYTKGKGNSSDMCLHWLNTRMV